MKKTRGEFILKDIYRVFRSKVDELHTQLVELESRREELLDLAPTSAIVTKVNVDATKVVKQLSEILEAKTNLQVQYEAYKLEFRELFGEEYVPLTISM